MVRSLFFASTLGLLSSLIALPHLDDAAAAPAEASQDADDHQRDHITWNGDDYTLRVERKRRAYHVYLTDSKGKSLADERIPNTALGSVKHLGIDAQIRNVRGQKPLLDVRVTADHTRDDAPIYQMIFLDTSRGPQQIWARRQATTGTGERFEIEDLYGDGNDQLVIYAQSPTVDFCGQEKSPLFPRVWNHKKGEFELISLPPALEEDTPTLIVQDAAPTRHYRVGTELRGVSSDAGHRVLRSYGRAPARLSDSDPSTTWLTQGPDGGIGNFLSAQINPHAGLAGIAYTLPEPAEQRPARIALHTESSTYTVTLPQDQRQGYIPLPGVEDTRCITLSILEVPRGAEQVGFATLKLYTGLDVEDPRTVFETRIFTPYKESDSRIEQERIAQLMHIDDPALAKQATALLQDLDRDAQVPIIDALMRTENGRTTLYKALENTELSSAAIAALGRALRQKPEETIAPLFDILDQTKKRNIRHSIVRILSRSLTEQDALRLLPYTHDAPSTSRGDLVFGLAQASKRQANALLHALDGSRVNDPIILRALIRIARRDTRIVTDLDEESLTKLRDALDHDNGTIARLAYELTGWLHIEALHDRLTSTFESDPQPTIRHAAFRGLIHYNETAPQKHLDTTLLRTALQSDDPTTRIEAARQFRGRNLAPDDIELLREAIKNERWPEATRPLLTALIRQSDPDLDHDISKLLLRKHRSLLRTALVAWQSRKDAPDFSVLEPLYVEAQTSDSLLASWVRAVSSIPSDAAAEALRSHQQDDTHSLRIRTELTEALGRQRNEQNIDLLIQTLTDASDAALRRAAARGLTWYTDDARVTSALEGAKSREEDKDVQNAIRHALRAIQSAKQARELLLHTDESDPQPSEDARKEASE